MKVVSINVSRPKEVFMNGRVVLTGIYKIPVQGQIQLRELGFDGDGQADLTVHGGEFQAVYGYPIEHYTHWEARLGNGPLEHGFFGENLTTEGLLETDTCIGDIFEMGTARLQVTMHRLPCFKFAHKIKHPELLKEFLWSGHSGYYFKVTQPGIITAGDSIKKVFSDSAGVTVRALLGMHKLNEFSPGRARRALEIDVLPPLIRSDFTQKLAEISAG